ncbi:MAG TPA: hypothetical protein VMV14_03625 [Acidimicrobiales bacterium]|nr:hypothetical protein [Acidimicrobiales bacterium]
MHEQLSMPWGAPRHRGLRPRSTPEPAGGPSIHRRRPSGAGRPVRGEPDVPVRPASPEEDWRIDQPTRRAGLAGLARARATLDAAGAEYVPKSQGKARTRGVAA